MKTGITIRKITVKDLPQVFDIQHSILQRKLKKTWIESVEAHLSKQELIGFVAVKDDQVIGFIIGDIKGPGFGIEQSGWIVEVGVYPRYMGDGIGKALAKRLFQHFVKKGFRDVYTAVRWDAGDMLSFFKSIGFYRSDFVNLGKHLE